MDAAEAIEHINRCAFLVDCPESSDHGRRLVHCRLGGIGCDWDADEAIALVDTAEQIEWGSSIMGTCLMVLSTPMPSLYDRQPKAKWYVFDTVTPPKED